MINFRVNDVTYFYKSLYFIDIRLVLVTFVFDDFMCYISNDLLLSFIFTKKII